MGTAIVAAASVNVGWMTLVSAYVGHVTRSHVYAPRVAHLIELSEPGTDYSLIN
jgi:hypothetical protein